MMIEKVSLNEKIQDELERDGALNANRFGRWPVIFALYPRLQGDKIAPKDFPLLRRRDNLSEVPSLQELKAAYYTVVNSLNKRFFDAVVPTPFEKSLEQSIKRNTRLKFQRNFWIGSRNVDLFFGCLCGSISSPNSYRGLAIEINGPVHDLALKMKKDDSKATLLHALGIAVWSVENTDVQTPQIQKVIRSLSDLPRLDSRARRRLMKRIYLETLVVHMPDAEFNAMFGVDANSDEGGVRE